MLLQLVVLFCIIHHVISSFILKERNIFHVRDNDFHVLGRANGNAMHTVIISLKQRNLNVLHDVLMETSNPDSSKFGKHLTRQEVIY